jgi:hypothetical protein
MNAPSTPASSVRYTILSDRFRSLWTFYQFLGGVLKHLGEGPMPYTYDFQALHSQLKDLVHKIGVESAADATPEVDQMERELDRIQRDLGKIDNEIPPSVMRKFFDHIKRQDERILGALLKFYLLSNYFEQDTLDKLDILFTRLAETPLEDGRVAPRDSDDLLLTFRRLGEFTELPPLPPAEAAALAEAVGAIRRELESIDDYQTLVRSEVYERYRKLKQRLGTTALHPSMLVEITATNIVAKNRFKDLFEAEERKVVENTNRIYDIERYLDRHPELASERLRRQIEEFRHVRIRYESSLRAENIKRDEITEMTRAMHAVLAQFDPSPSRLVRPNDITAGIPIAGLEAPVSTGGTGGGSTPLEEPERPATRAGGGDRQQETTLTDILPSDPLLNESLHKIMFALEMVVWDRLPAQVTDSPEVRNLNLEPWEVATYRKLSEGNVDKGTAEWELDRFFLTSAALRLKMEEERNEITRLESANTSDRLFEVLERSARSLDRARDMDSRFQWFIDDMVFRGETRQLESLYRSRFRFLHAYSGLWLMHQQSGGLTPL